MKQKFRGSREKLATFRVVEIPNSVDIFRRKYLFPKKQQIIRKFLYLVSRYVGLNPDINTSVVKTACEITRLKSIL